MVSKAGRIGLSLMRRYRNSAPTMRCAVPRAASVSTVLRIVGCELRHYHWRATHGNKTLQCIVTHRDAANGRLQQIEDLCLQQDLPA